MGGSFSNQNGPDRQPRPPGRAEIGRAAWRYVHSAAANYPEQPDAVSKVCALQWLRSFVHLYPCQLCAREFIEVCSDLPPQLETRQSYCMWWCEAHNRVRADLSQTLRQCIPSDVIRAGLAELTLDEFYGNSQAEGQDQPQTDATTPNIHPASVSPGDCAACNA